MHKHSVLQDYKFKAFLKFKQTCAKMNGPQSSVLQRSHYTQIYQLVKILKCISLVLILIIPPPQNVGVYTGFALSRRSVGRSVRPSPIRVRSITPLLMEGFPSNFNDTFTSTRGCAEPMLLMCQLKVKVTVKGQIFNKQILHI